MQAAEACNPIRKSSNLGEILNADAVVSARIIESTVLEYQGTVRRVPVTRLLLVDVNHVLLGTIDDFTGGDKRFELYATVPHHTGTFTPLADGGEYVVAALYKGSSNSREIAPPIAQAIVPDQRDAYLAADPKYHVASRGCGFAWIHDSDGPVAKAIRQVLDDRGDQDAEIAVLGEFLKLDGRIYQNGQLVLDADGRPVIE